MLWPQREREKMKSIGGLLGHDSVTRRKSKSGYGQNQKGGGELLISLIDVVEDALFVCGCSRSKIVRYAYHVSSSAALLCG